MICKRCESRIPKPKMDLGGAWLWECACGKSEIAPVQQRRGQVIRSGFVESVIECAGEIETP